MQQATRNTEPQAAWVDHGAVRLHGANGGAELAGRLLAADGVRSVVVDHHRDEATVHLRDDRTKPAKQETLRQIVALANQQQSGLDLVAKQISHDAQIVCWLDRRGGVDSYFRAPVMATGWKRLAYLAGAAVTFLLAVLGAILPGLPTTPFLLVTSYCLLRSSRRLHDRLLRSRMFGQLLRDWHACRGVRPGVKTKSLAVMAIVILATVLLSGLPTRALIGIVGCSLIGVVCILRLRVIR